MSKKYYVVWAGRKTGVFDSWKDCQEQTIKFSGARFKSFDSLNAANDAFKEEGGNGKVSVINGVPTKSDLESGAYKIPDYLDFIKLGDIVVFTDGSLLQGRVNNMDGTIGGYGAWMIHKNGEKTISDGFRNTTISRMELMACVESLKLVNEKLNIHIYSDSSYVVNTINKKWKRKANKDLWKEMDSLLSKRKVKFYWVSGHSGIEGNEKADALATAASANIMDNRLVEWKIDKGANNE